MRVLIAGCGDVGSVLAQRLLQSDHTVFGLKRNTSTLPDGVEAIASDLTQVSTLTNLPDNLDRLVYMPTPSQRTEESYSDIFVQGWQNLWNALPRPPTRSLLVSSTAVYGQSDGSWVDENTIALPARFNGRVLLKMEQLARASGSRIVVARLSGIYGPARRRLIRLATKGEPLTSASKAFSNRIHIEDAGAALAHLLVMKQPKELYLVSDDCPVAKYEVVAWLAQKMGRSPPQMLSANTSDMTDSGMGKKVSNKRLRDSGFVLEFPDYRVGYGSILQQRNQNELSG